MQDSEATKLAMQIIALQAVCAAILTEVALLDKDPSSRLGRITSRLLGIADALASQAAAEGADTTLISKTLEQIASMSELALVPPKGREQTDRSAHGKPLR